MKFLSCFLVVSSVCLIGVLARSECEEQRKKALKGKEKWIPKCTDSGKFEALQCYEKSSECMCVRPDGTHITEPSSKTKSCKCHTHRDNVASKRLIGSYKPQCEEDGTYKTTQCHGSTGACWCTDENGKKVNKTLDKC